MTPIRQWLGSASLGLAAILGLGSLVACSDAGGPAYITLGVSVRSTAGGTGGSGSTSGEPATLCVRLPVLLGSRVVKRASVQGGLKVEMHATRDGTEVTFPGATGSAGARNYTLDELQAGVSETVMLEAAGGTYDATIATGCTNP